MQIGHDPRNDRSRSPEYAGSSFLLGDTIDRGPESRALLEWVLDTDWVYSVMGNHELMFIAGTEDNRNRYKQWGDGR